MSQYSHKDFHFVSHVPITAAFICKSLGGHRCGNGYMALCPSHSDSDCSLSLKDTPDGHVLAHCFAGCSQVKVISALSARGLWSRSSAQNPVIPQIPKPDKRKFDALQRVWSQSKQIAAGDPVDCYLTARGIHLNEYPIILRFNPSLGYWIGKECKGHYPAMVARVENLQGDLVSIHRTFLALTGTGKALVSHPKKLMSPEYSGGTKGAAIRLFEAREVLAVAEGIETALAVHIQTGLPCWATVSASGMEAIQIPDYVRMVVIGADRDKSQVGEQAAKALARRLLRDGRRCKILIPETVGTDWADPLEARRG